MPNVWHVFSFYNSTFAKREVKEVREFKEVKGVKGVKGVKAICFIAKYTTKKAVPIIWNSLQPIKIHILFSTKPKSTFNFF